MLIPASNAHHHHRSIKPIRTTKNMPPRANANNDFKLLAAILKSLEARVVNWKDVGTLLGGQNPDARQRWDRLRNREESLRGVVINTRKGARRGRQQIPRNANDGPTKANGVEEPEDLDIGALTVDDDKKDAFEREEEEEEGEDSDA